MFIHKQVHSKHHGLTMVGVLALSSGILSCRPQATDIEKTTQALVFADIQNAGSGSVEDNKMLFEVDEVLPGQDIATFLAPTAIEHVFADFAANSGERSVLFVADTLNNVIRRVELDNGMTSTFAGTRVEGFADGPASQALFRRPAGLAASSSLVYWSGRELSRVQNTFGALFVADTGNHVIRRIDFTTRTVSTVAGQPGRPGLSDGGDGVAFDPSSARFNQPTGMVFVPGENVLYVADTGNSRIRKLTLSDDGETVLNVDTVSVSPSSFLKRPTALAIDKTTTNGNAVVYLYIADPGAHAVQKLRLSNGGLDSPIGLTHQYGHVDAVSFSSVARLAAPSGLAVFLDSAGRKALYISDAASHTIRRYWISAPPPGKQRVETPWGDPWKPGRAEGPGTGAQFNSPTGLVAVGVRYPREHQATELVIVDQGNHALRRIVAPSTTATPNAPVFVGDPVRPGADDGWPARRSIGVPRGLACNNGRLYVSGNGIHEVNPTNRGARTLSPLNVGETVAASTNFAFVATQYGLASINLATLARQVNGNPSGGGASFAQIFGASNNYAYGTFGGDNDSTAVLTAWRQEDIGQSFGLSNDATNDTQGTVSEDYVYFQNQNLKLFRIPTETTSSPAMVPVQVARNVGQLPQKFAISGNHLYEASGSSITRRALPSNPENPLVDADPSFTISQFEDLNGTICVEGNTMVVGDNSGRLHQVDLATRQVQELVPDFSVAP